MKKVAIPEKMQKFYGTGIMLHPDKVMVEEIMQKVPFGKITTIDAFCDKLAQDHGTNITCPMRTSHLVKTITETYSYSNVPIPFWRVIRKNHLLINTPFTALCSENLKKEGFQVDVTSRGEFKVLEVEGRLFTF